MAEATAVTFEDGHQQLKDIVARLDAEDVSVHESCELFAQGKGLEKSLRAYLDEQKGKLDNIEAGHNLPEFRIVPPAAPDLLVVDLHELAFGWPLADAPGVAAPNDAAEFCVLVGQREVRMPANGLAPLDFTLNPAVPNLTQGTSDIGGQLRDARGGGLGRGFQRLRGFEGARHGGRDSRPTRRCHRDQRARNGPRPPG